MNDRIIELAEQAGFYVADGKIYIPTTSEEITECQKKFAELIVRECANYITEYYPHSRYEAFYMKKHFGVEE